MERDTNNSISETPFASLIKHYTKIIDEEKQTLEGILKEVTTKIKQTTKKHTCYKMEGIKTDGTRRSQKRSVMT